jgi:GNAT superfamily N-acetyltransferase
VTDGPHVWVAEPDEAETVARLLVGFRDHLGHDWPSANAFLAGVEKLIEDRNAEFVIGAPDADAPPAGVVSLRYRHSLWTASDDCLLEDVFVEESARGTGLGRALVVFALDRARERGCRRAELDVNEGNEAALRLYESLGFGKNSTPWEGRDLFVNVRLD